MDHSVETPYVASTAPYGASIHHEAHSSGVSWSAVIAGAFVTAALALILLSLGSGLGLSSVSMWSNQSISSSALGMGAILWLILMQIVSASMGGYLAGRLRTKWTTIHSDEVYFRDTAHGFLAWSVALVLTAAFLASAATSLVGSTLESGQAAKPGSAAQSEGPNAYFVDSLFRGEPAKADGLTPARRAEVAVIFGKDLKAGGIPANDQAYLDQLVSADTGMSQADADRRVTQTFMDAQQAAETARKAIAHTLLWGFISLLIGAFCASVAATIGGRQRDHVVTI